MSLAVPARTAADLAAALRDAPRPDAPLTDRHLWLKAVLRILRPHRGLGSALQERAADARLRALVHLLREDAPSRQRAAALVRSVLAEASGFDFYGETGTGRVGFTGEMLDRLTRRVLPSVPDETDLGLLAERLFPREADVSWLEQMPSELAAELWSLLDDPEAPLSGILARDMADAMAVVALRAAARAFADDIRARRSSASIRGSAFHRLAPATEALLDAPPELRAERRAALHEAIAGARRGLGEVQRHLKDSGVSVDLVYRLELIARNLDRLEALSGLLVPEEGASRPVVSRRALDLVADLLRQRHEARSLTGLVHASTHLLARKMIERAGHSGEHYITSTRGEHRAMFLSAILGGFLVAPAIAGKFLVTWAAPPPFFEMILTSLNYAASFVVLHLLGGTLATKQPAVTAASLAAAIHSAGRRMDLKGLAEQVARVTRSQLAAVAGNLLAVIPAAVALDGLSRLLRGRPFLDPPTAEYAVHSLDPLRTGTVAFALLTGVLLWVGSMCASGAENWWAYRRLPEALAGHRRLLRLLGRERTERLAKGLSHQVGALAGNVSLGTLLGSLPVLGRFFGAPLEVRHVTFSTGLLALSVAAQPPGLRPFLLAVAGIAAIGVLNLAVSFALALAVALRARDVHHALRDLAGAVLIRLRVAPREFFWPPPERGDAAAAGSAAPAGHA
jgi:site-specific recombinase